MELEHEISPRKIYECLSSFKLEGRCLKEIFVDSIIFNLNQDELEESVYSSLEGRYEEKRLQELSEMDNFDPSFLFERMVKGDNHIIFIFDDGMSLSFETEFDPDYSIKFVEFNKITLDDGWHSIDLRKLFNPVLGKKVVSFKLNLKKASESHSSYYDLEPEQDIVDSIDIIFDDGYVARVSAYIDFIWIELIDPNGNASSIPWRELKDCIGSI